MRKIFLFLFIIISVQSFAQLRKDQLNAINARDVKSSGGYSSLKMGKLIDSLILSLNSQKRASGYIPVGNVSGISVDVPLSGDGTLSSAGALSVLKIKGNTVPVNAAGSLTNDGSGNLSWTTTSIPSASPTTAGIAKLYTSTGSNTDGSMDQNSITSELNGKAPGTSGSFPLRGNGSGGFVNLVWPSSGQLIMSTGIDFANSNVSSDGTTATFGAVPNFPSQTANKFFASPDGSSGVPSFRILVSGDIPNNAANTTGSAAKWTTARNLAGNSVDGSANVAFSNKFIVQGTTDAGLSGAQFLGALGTGIVKNTTTTGVLSIASAGTDYEVPLTFSTGLTRSTNTITVNTSQNISTLSNLTSNGFITTSGGTGALSITVPGTGVATWITTPSWTNFTSAITGTAPYWNTGGTTTLISANTIASTTPNGLNFNSIFTATANNQWAVLNDGTITTRANASDVFDVLKFKHVINPGATTQNLTDLTIDATFNLKGGVSTFGSLQGNTTAGCTNGTTSAFSGYTYTNQDGTGATGTGATFNVTVSGNVISSIAINAAGSGYKIGDKFLFNGSSFGGSGSAYVEISSLASMTLSTNSSPLRVINRIYIPPQTTVSPLTKLVDLQTLDGTGTPVTRIYLGYYQNGGSTATSAMGDQFGELFSSNASSINFSRAISTSSAITFNGALTTKEISYNGVNVGTGASLNFLTSSVAQRMSVASQAFTALTTSNTITSGLPATGSITNAGSGYTNGSYSTVTATGGTGTGLLFSTITVSGGVVTAATMSANNAINYKVGDVISVNAASVGGTGSGFQYTLSAVDFSGGVFATVRNIQTITDNGSGANIYATVYDKRTITQNNTAGTPYFTSLESNLTVSSGTPNIYPILLRNAAGLNGFAIGASAPLSTVDINGSIGGGIVTSTGNLTLDATNYIIIITSGTGTYTFPSASGATRRVYCLVNQTGGARTTSSYKDKSNASQTTVAANAVIWIASDGSNWYQIN